MKKFVFRLQSLLGVKEALEKDQKALLAEVRGRLAAQQQQLADLLHKQERIKTEYFKAAREGMIAAEMQMYGHFFEHMRDAIIEQRSRIEQTKQEVIKRQEELLRTMREVKTLYKLKDTKYQEYLTEAAQEEEKAIGDIVSFQVVTAQEAGALEEAARAVADISRGQMAERE